jgi:signal transduction histidine kinase
MIIFTLVNYFSNFKKEFLYYCGFATCIFFLIFFLSLILAKSGPFANFFMSYFATALLFMGTLFYSAFTRWFLNTRTDYKGLHKLFKAQEYLLFGLLMVYSIIHFFTPYLREQYMLEIFMKLLALLIGIVYVIIAFTRKNWLMNYLAIGNGAYILFSCFSLVGLLLSNRNFVLAPYSLLLFETGLVLAIIFFLIGLAHKNRRFLIASTKEQEELKRLAERQELEKQLAILKAQQDERNRISADMHDDLGAGMTAIRLYSELAKSKMGKDGLMEINKISSSANDLLNKMNAIIWSMNSNNDTFPNLVAYLRSYALEYFEGTPIKCIIHLPDDIPDFEVSGDHRRNIFLVYKEALNNIVKHAQASIVTITLNTYPDHLELLIHDNGRGIDLDNIREFGNGLKNMRKRMQDVNIEFDIRNDHGTLITMTRKLTGPVSGIKKP